MVIAILLGLTAFFLGAVNMRYLADVRDKEAEAVFVEIAGQHSEIERYHDLRSIIIGKSNILALRLGFPEIEIIPTERHQHRKILYILGYVRT